MHAPLLQAAVIAGWLVLSAGAICILAYRRASLAASTGELLALLAVYWLLGAAPLGWKVVLCVALSLGIIGESEAARLRAPHELGVGAGAEA